MATSSQYGSFVPTTNVWDVTQIYSTDINSQEFKELLVRLYQNLNLMANIVNLKDTGIYTNAFETACGQSWFQNPANTSATTANATLRPVFRTTINFGALPNTATKSVAHNINPNSGFSVTRMYGAATDPVGLNYIPIPAEAPSISLTADSTNVNVTTFSDRTAFTICYIIIEYIKS